MAVFKMIAALELFAAVAVAQNCARLEPAAQLNVASGYTASVILNDLNMPRGIVFDTAGNLLVAEQGGSGIRRVVLTEDEDRNPCVASSSQLIADRTLNHGIAISQDGKTLFVSNMADVHSYPYDVEAGTVGTKKTIISGMRSGGHITRTLLAPITAPDTLLVSRGSDGNIDNTTVDTAASKSMIKAFNVTELLALPDAVDYATGGEVLGWGLRNSVGVGEDPSTGGIWSVENSADEIHRGDTDLHNNNPAEEMNYHGVLKDVDNPPKGINYGYPACFSAWQITEIPSNAGITIGSQFGGLAGTPYLEVTEAESMEEVDTFCRTQRQGPHLVFPSHTAPLDIKFKEDGSAAYIAFHGSWNRQPPDGFRLGKIDFESGQPVAEVSDTAAVTYIVQNQDVTQCPGACLRPVGLAFDKQGRLFMTSDASGELYVIGGV
ncbi:soluble quino protein glucose/sorbosone dehydrogenase [Biscogniauxia marginata]|nr:soluble quino protein glucose/sorbosone dehydrogenase [Biscogniauxia marginata]